MFAINLDKLTPALASSTSSLINLFLFIINNSSLLTHAKFSIDVLVVSLSKNIIVWPGWTSPWCFSHMNHKEEADHRDMH